MISSAGGMTLGKGGMQIQVLGAGLAQMPAPQPPAPVQTQVKDHSMLVRSKNQLPVFKIQSEGDLFVLTQTTMKMPFSTEPSKEARCVLRTF